MKCAVVLSGCGYLDGSEIREAVLSLLALDLEAFKVEIFAPEKTLDETDHLTQKPTGKKRSVLEESARIARSEIKPLNDLKPENFEALVLPGGFGAAKNLSDFAQSGSEMSLDPQLEQILSNFARAKKPVGAICIAPVLLAKIFQKQGGALLSLGAAGSDAAKALEILGSKHQACRANEIAVDADHRVVTTPAYMWPEASLKDVFQGIQQLVSQLKKWCEKS